MLQSYKRQDVKARLIFWICVQLLLICIFEIVQTISLKHQISYLVNFSLACLMPLFCALAYDWYVYVFSVLRPRRKLREVPFDRFFRVVIVLYSLFSFTSPWHNLLFVVSEEGVEIRGGYMWTVVAIPWMCGVLSIYMCIRDLHYARRRLTVSASLGIIFLTLLGMVSGIVQYSTFLPVVAPSVTLGMLIYFISLQNTWISKDPLTKLNNRSCLSSFLKYNYRSRAKNLQPYVLYFDVNRFKKINDNYGHVAGDLALKLIAEVLMQKLEHTRHFVCRMGGDEFVAILFVQDDLEVKDFILTTRELINLRSEQEDLPFKISISIGVARLDDHGRNFDEALSQAEGEMYSEKQYGASLL
ncbi:MAG: GGDEF domain-containing protein [Succinivibrio sp.]|nr:GGDEF domain-containing protein [Succinivibrio sp.]